MQSQVKIGKKAKTRAAYWKKFGGGWVVAGLVDYKKYSRFVRGDQGEYREAHLLSGP